MTRFDTIVAPATPGGRSALAIVRLDGSSVSSILSALSGDREFPDRVAVHTRLESSETLDDCVVIFYRAPRSYTGNDLAEIILHGNPLLVERLIAAAVAAGARMAEPGEFTERAVLNGKLDLVQAEAVAGLIAARTPLQASLSLTNLSGELSRRATALREEFLFLISRLEAALDFSEEGYEFIKHDDLKTRCSQLQRSVREIRETFHRGKLSHTGITAAIIGRPNAGKSTLLNFLCGSDRAIVTPHPGTTRDLLRETVEIGGLPVTLVDTAGLRESGDVVEEIGVGRARAAAAQAELVLYLIDASIGMDAIDEEESRRFPGAMLLYTKCDLAAAPAGAVGVSVQEGMGLDLLMSELDRRVKEEFAIPEGTPALINERQWLALEECEAGLRDLLEAIDAGRNEEILLVDLYRAANSIALLTGAVTQGDVMKEIFEKFCIGK